MSPASPVPPRLIAITDLSVAAEELLLARLRRLSQRARPGTVALLLRDHTASARQRLALGARLQSIAHDWQQQLWVADRLDLALLLRADGVHLGEGSVSALVARSLLGDAMRISRAWHAPTLAVAAPTAELGAVDALLVSPLLAPRKGRAALGLSTLGGLGEQLRARNWACQMYALGGVSAENAAACRHAGAYGVAAIGAALSNDSDALLSALEILR